MIESEHTTNPPDSEFVEQPGHGPVNAADVERYLKDIQFPCDKQGIIDHAINNGAPRGVMDLLKRFPEGEYGNPIDISKSLSEVEL